MSAGSRASDLTDVCRLCLDKERLLFPVFESDGLPSKIASCLQVEIQRTDELTQKICDDCANKVDAFYEFRNKTACSQKELEKWLMETKKEERQNQVLQLRELKATINQPKKVEEHGASPDEEDKEQEEEGNEELDEENDEDFDEEYETEECMNGDEEIRDDEQWNEEAKGKDELDFGPEPTNFVNVPSLDSEEPGPSGFQPPETDSLAVPEFGDEETLLSFNWIKHYRCLVCCKDFPSCEEQKMHLCVRESKKRFKCPTCFRLYGKRYLLKRHMVVHSEDRPFKCLSCARTFKRSQALAKHISCHTRINEFTCDTCGKTFYERSKMVSHQITHRDAKLKCDICGKCFRWRKNLVDHINMHLKIKPKQCDVCGMKFRNTGHLSSHRVKHEDNYRLPEFICSVCPSVYKSRYGFARHMKEHSEGPLKVSCSVCDKVLSSNSYLKVHMRKHTGEKPFECQHCEKAFSSLKFLKDHRVVHSGERPFDCTDCGKTFTQKSSLNTHRKKLHMCQ